MPLPADTFLSSLTRPLTPRSAHAWPAPHAGSPPTGATPAAEDFSTSHRTRPFPRPCACRHACAHQWRRSREARRLPGRSPSRPGSHTMACRLPPLAGIPIVLAAAPPATRTQIVHSVLVDGRPARARLSTCTHGPPCRSLSWRHPTFLDLMRLEGRLEAAVVRDNIQQACPTRPHEASTARHSRTRGHRRGVSAAGDVAPRSPVSSPVRQLARRTDASGESLDHLVHHHHLVPIMPNHVAGCARHGSHGCDCRKYSAT